MSEQKRKLPQLQVILFFFMETSQNDYFISYWTSYKMIGFKSSGASSIQICISVSRFALLARAWATKFPLHFTWEKEWKL